MPNHIKMNNLLLYVMCKRYMLHIDLLCPHTVKCTFKNAEISIKGLFKSQYV